MQDNQRAEWILKQETDLMREAGRISRVQSNSIKAGRQNMICDKTMAGKFIVSSWYMQKNVQSKLEFIVSIT